MGEVYIDQGWSEERWQADARSRAVDRRPDASALMPPGSYWVAFYDNRGQEIYGFWLVRERKLRFTDSASDRFVIRSLTGYGLENRMLYFEIGTARGPNGDPFGYGLNAESNGLDPVNWIRQQLLVIKDRAAAKFACLNASEWFFVDTDYDSRSGRRLRIPATMIDHILVCKHRPARQIGDLYIEATWNKCGQFPDGGQTFGEWVEDASGEDGTMRTSRRNC